MDHKSQLLESAQKSWMNLFIRNTKIAWLAVVFILFMGAMSFYQIPKEAAPKINYGIIIINTPYLGASAYDMDQLVTQEIENKIKDVDDINKISSISKDGISSITIELTPYANVEKSLNDIRSKVDEAKAKLPEDAEDPIIQEITSTNADPIFYIHLTGDIHPVLLRDYAEELKRHLDGDKYIQEINISGGAEREIHVQLDPIKLHEYKVSEQEVIQAIQLSHRDSPIGSFTIDGLDYNLRIQGKLKNAEDISNVIIKTQKSQTQDTVIIQLSDIAKVFETQEEIQSIETLTDMNEKSRRNTVKLQVIKTAGTDIFQADPHVREEAINFVQKNWGNEVKVYFTSELLENVRDSYDTVAKSGIQSIIIVFLLLILFIGSKEGFVAGIIIPLTFLTTIATTFFMGNTLNFMVNFSLILALGILVDTAIVIVEGIYEGIRQGFTPKEAAMIALYEFRAPLTSGMLTTLAVFIPLLTLPGVLGKYLSFIPISVSITLIASLLISLLVIPGIASTILQSKDEKKSHPPRFFLHKILRKYHHWHHQKIEKISNIYKSFLEKKLHSRFFRIGIIYSVIILFIITTFIPVKFVMFPADDLDFFNIRTELAAGSQEKDVWLASIEVEKILLDVPEIKRIENSVSDNVSNITVHLFKKDIRQERKLRTSIDLAADLRKELKKFKNYDVRLQEASNGPPGGTAVGFKIIIDDPDKLSLAKSVAEDFKIALKNIPGAENIRDDIKYSPGEINYTINTEEAARLDVPVTSISTTLRTAIQGIDAITLSRGDREVDVKVEYTNDSLQNFTDISNIQILNKKGEYISLSQVVIPQLQESFRNIKRIDRQISITVGSDLSKDGNAAEVTSAFYAWLESYELPDGVKIENIGENAENADLFVALGFGFVVAVLMIFSILVIQFNSFAQPFIIVFTIFMSLLGVNIGLGITDTPRSLAFIIGVISLAGIVVNDAIILVDRINTLRKQYQTHFLGDVIAHAGSTRLQPIVLTTLTTAAGIFPLIFVNTFWAGLAITIIFGLSVASSLTLFVTPAMYYQFEKELKVTLLPFPAIIGAVIALISLFKLNIIGIVIGTLLVTIFTLWFKKELKKKALVYSILN